MVSGNTASRSPLGSRRKQSKVFNAESASKNELNSKASTKQPKSKKATGGRRSRVSPQGANDRTIDMADGANGANNGRSFKKNLRVETARPDETTANGVQPTPANVRGSRDLRSPGVPKTPAAPAQSALPDFITQTDAHGNATTPRTAKGIDSARQIRPVGQSAVAPGRKNPPADDDSDNDLPFGDDPCETLMDSLRLMCCCIVPDDGAKARIGASSTQDSSVSRPDGVRLLGAIHPNDKGKKCLVLDLDETLVHSSFRAVPGADFVIPVQIEDVVHLVYVMKRPGVDEFLVEMAKHYEIVIYTASLNKYADPLLDLLDPHQVIRYRLFRESCVYHEGNYVKDMSLINRDLSQSIIIDNSPNSYMFHPENAIDCSSFIDDPNDRELDQIGAFLAGIKSIGDVRNVAPRWRDWPNLDIPQQKHR